MSGPIILASASPYRAMLLKNAGIAFETQKPDIDERAAEAPLKESGASPEDIASILAEVKAEDVSRRNPAAVVIGSDQTLSLGDEVLHKAPDMEAARRRLITLSGKTHQLNTAVVVAQGGVAVWRDVSIAHMTMRTLEPAFIGRFMARAGNKALTSVGAYTIEDEGIQLFERIEGDYFAIVGLPLLPLLRQLRSMGAIDA